MPALGDAWRSVRGTSRLGAGLNLRDLVLARNVGLQVPVVPVQPCDRRPGVVPRRGGFCATIWDMRARLVSVIGAAALVVGTATIASAGTPVRSRPLGPAALASALERHPFPTTNLGYTVTSLGSQPPSPAGDFWILTWQAPATAPEVNFQFFLFRTTRAADDDWKYWEKAVERSKEQIWDLADPPLAWCGGGTDAYFTCWWIDASVEMTCSGGPPASVSSLCQGLFVASRTDLKEVDPRGGF